MANVNVRLKSHGKHGNASRRPVTVYDETGGWSVTQHQGTLRLLTNTLFEQYYGELQQLGRLLDQTHMRTGDACRAQESGCGSSASSGMSGGKAGVYDTAAELWAREVARFRTPLPITFWINDTDPLAPSLRRYFESLDSSVIQPIAWYPLPGMAWRILADKTEFRRRPELQTLRQCLIEQTALGTISRQEEVSMIPTFLLQIQPSDVCLEMCASPGSKTAQMLVALGRQKTVSFASSQSPFPFDYESDGLVVANELDTKRANMLVHQVKRMRLLFPFALFTNHDARYFPEIASCADGGSIAGPHSLISSAGSHVPNVSTANAVQEPKTMHVSDSNEALLSQGTSDAECTSSHGTGTINSGSVTGTATKPLRFDKILCDVVCSGDGTLRKAPHIFKIWSPYEAITLQRTQIQIALRACHLLKKGGRLVYSTCSLNPIENEAVVAQIVHRTGGAMRLRDVGAHVLPQLSCAKGLQTWVVTDAHGTVFTQPTRASETDKSEGRSTKCNGSSSASDPSRRTYAHTKCCRVCASGQTREAEGGKEAECDEEATSTSCLHTMEQHVQGPHQLKEGDKTEPTRRGTRSGRRAGSAGCGHFVMHEALFPPNTPGGYRSAAVDALDLRRCIRLLPSHCNGGGFFVAVLDKVSDFSLPRRRSHTETAGDEDDCDNGTENDPCTANGDCTGTVKDAKSQRPLCNEADRPAAFSSHTVHAEQMRRDDAVGRARVVSACCAATHDLSVSSASRTPNADTRACSVREETVHNTPPSGRAVVPPQYASAPESIRAAVRDFYEIPSFPMHHLVVRTAHGERVLRLTPSSVCTFVVKTALHVLQHKSDALTVVSAGLRVLAYETLDKGWRITSESALLFAKLMQSSSRFVRVPVSLVAEMINKGGKLKEVALEDIADAALRARAEQLSLGVCLLGIDASPQMPHPETGVVVAHYAACDASQLFYSVALRARSRLQLFVDHEDLVGLQLRLGLTPHASMPSRPASSMGDDVHK